MNAREYMNLVSKPQLEELCAKAGTTVSYFEQIARNHRRPSYKLCRRLEEASGGDMTWQELITAIDYRKGAA